MTYPSAIAAFAVGMVIVLSPWLSLKSVAGETTSETLIPIKTPKGFIVTAELADTPMKRGRGLMFREHLADDRGMLFTFTDAQPHTFWMKNTKIPLDIIWMDDKRKIIHIERNVPICTYQDDSCPQYRPNEGALYVLELGAGRADSLQLQRGMRLDFKLP
ncbi:MAG TPA: DUF192 domain-containing protein [Nitrospiraceae bacterium]|jgi:uncharacterized membrane protein (UPF0127 family)|nr:DUF192 domain-containing protein [Nitrospiraceae bacterium]